VGGSAVAGPLFFLFWCKFFLVCGGVGFLQGFLRRMRVLVWCFCGEGVVICVADVVFSRHVLGVSKCDTFLNFIFWW
jgi:hypothetical protein